MGPMFDILIIGLLTITCIFCLVLNRRLSRLRQGQVDLATSISEFDEAVLQARQTLAGMDERAKRQHQEIAQRARAAEELATDLSVMISSGNRVADRIESAMEDVRTIANGKKVA